MRKFAAVSAARGTFSATVTATETGAAVAWQLTFSGTSGAVAAAHIHLGPRGQAGGVVVPLCGPCVSPASGTANVDASVVSALQTGAMYANAHTATNKAGEIRGQIGVLANVTTALNARQEVPKTTGNTGRAKGTFTATVTKDGTTLNVSRQPILPVAPRRRARLSRACLCGCGRQALAPSVRPRRWAASSTAVSSSASPRQTSQSSKSFSSQPPSVDIDAEKASWSDRVLEGVTDIDPPPHDVPRWKRIRPWLKSLFRR